MAEQARGLEDRFFNNTVIQLTGPLLGGSGVNACVVMNATNTTVFTKSGFMISGCGGSVATSGLGNTVAELPADDDVIDWAKALLGVVQG
jgi:hypothetical protein